MAILRGVADLDVTTLGVWDLGTGMGAAWAHPAARAGEHETELFQETPLMVLDVLTVVTLSGMYSTLLTFEKALDTSAWNEVDEVCTFVYTVEWLMILQTLPSARICVWLVVLCLRWILLDVSDSCRSQEAAC